MVRKMIACRIPCVCVMVFLLAGPASGQILNTLRGWSDIEQGWSLGLEGMISFSEGNTEHLNLSTGGSVQLLSGGHRVRFLISETYTTAGGDRVAEDFKVHLRHNFRLTPVFHTLAFLQTQYNPFQRLERRSLLGGGIRADLVRDSLCSMALGASVMLESVELTDDSLDESGSNTRGSFFLSLVWKPVRGSIIDFSGFYQPLLPGFDGPLLMAALDMQAELVGHLAMFTGAYLSYDSRPPEGVETTDLSVSSGLRFSL